MRTLDEVLADAPAFAGLEARHLELISGCARNAVFSAGEYMMREGERADVFHAIRHGSVVLETFAPERGAVLIETLHQHDLVGWSWLVAPYRTHFDVRALEDTRTVAFDGACLRGKCEQDPVLGYELHKRFAAVIVERLQATRLRLLDVYGHVPDG